MPDVILPCLDEARALPWVLSRMPPGYRAIVADNGSSDDSVRIAREHGALVVEEPVKGFGSACWAGLASATNAVVCFMDADGSCDPLQLPRLARSVLDGRADLILGARIPVGDAWPMHARIANRALASMTNRRSGLNLRDCGPMRAMSRERLLQLGMVDRRFGWPLEMVLRASAAGWRIEEIPVDYLHRVGRSKVTGTVRGTVRTVRDMRRVMRDVG